MKKLLAISLMPLLLSGCASEPDDVFYKFLNTYEGMEFCDDLDNWNYISGDYLEGASDEFEASHPEHNSAEDVKIWQQFKDNADLAQEWLYKLNPVPDSELKKAAIRAMEHQVDLVEVGSDVDIVLSFDNWDQIDRRKAAIERYSGKWYGTAELESACVTALGQ